jgi:hypothetical protein
LDAEAERVERDDTDVRGDDDVERVVFDDAECVTVAE